MFIFYQVLIMPRKPYDYFYFLYVIEAGLSILKGLAIFLGG